MLTNARGSIRGALERTHACYSNAALCLGKWKVTGEMESHWREYDNFLRNLDLADARTRMQYARYGLIASLSRGTCDRFSTTSNHRNMIWADVPLSTALEEGPNYNGLKKLGNFMCHKASELNYSVDLQNYTFWMLHIRHKLFNILCDVQTKYKVEDDPRNKDVVAFWATALGKFNAISKSTHGGLACFLDYNTGRVIPSNAASAKRCVDYFKQQTQLPPLWAWKSDWYVGKHKKYTKEQFAEREAAHNAEVRNIKLKIDVGQQKLEAGRRAEENEKLYADGNTPNAVNYSNIMTKSKEDLN